MLQLVCGNAIAEIEGEKCGNEFVAMTSMALPIAEIEGKKIVGMNFWQWHCQNRRKKNLFMLVCGNAIAEIGGKKIVAIVAMPLPKIWEEKKNSGCRNHM